MDFVIQEETHEEHDGIWALHSLHHGCLVCVACIAEVLEVHDLMPLQKKPALAELSRLLTQQSAELLQIFMHEERIVWHFLEILIDNLRVKDDTYLSLSIEAVLKMIQKVQSEDLVTYVLDRIMEHVQSITNSADIVPDITLLGKLIQSLPALSQTLLSQYSDFLLNLGQELHGSGETIQSAVAYIFIFLCEKENIVLMSPRLQQMLQEGLLHMLSTAKTESVQVNALGLLKKLVADNDSCRSLMALRKDGTCILVSLKKLLLSKKPVLLISVVQMLAQLLVKPEANQYGTSILESDITDMQKSLLLKNQVSESGDPDQQQRQRRSCWSGSPLFEKCRRCILKLLHQLAALEKFYKRCHAVYGIESILHAISTAQSLKNGSVLSVAFYLLAEILNRQPTGVPLFLNSSLVRRCLGLIQPGLEHPDALVSLAALAALTAIIRKDHLLLPVPLTDIIALITTVSNKQKLQCAPKHFKVKKSRASNQDDQKEEEANNAVKLYISLMVKVCKLANQCHSDEPAIESNFSAPGSDQQESSLDKFVHHLIRLCDETCIPVIMMQWDRVQEIQIKSLELVSVLYEINPASASGVVFKMTSAGFLINVIEAGTVHRDHEFKEMCSKFLRLTVISCQDQGLLPSNVPETFLTADKLPWKFSELVQAFEEEYPDEGIIEAYLVVIYISYKLENRILSTADLANILVTTAEIRRSLEELSPLCRKYFLYLFAHVHPEIEMHCLRPVDVPMANSADPDEISLEGLHSLLGAPWEDWYSHSVVMLQWCFSDDSLTNVAGQAMLDAYLCNTSEEQLQEHLESVSERSDGAALLALCDSWTFVSTLIEGLASQSANNVSKIVLLLEWAFQKGPICQGNDDPASVILHHTTEVLKNVFLQNYPDAAEQNVIGLLQLMLILMKKSSYLQQPQIDVKILYHVMNNLTKTDQLSSSLNRSYLLTILAAVSSVTNTDNHVCAVLVQNEGVMKHLQTRLHGEKDMLYCISCDIIVCLLQYPNLQSCSPVSVDLTGVELSVCKDQGDVQVASLNLLSALFATDLQHGTIQVQGNLTDTQYRTLQIYLQQIIVQDVAELSESAVECFKNVISYLHKTKLELAAELLTQSWNNMLLDIALDVCMERESVTHTKLIAVFTNYEEGCQLIRSNNGLIKKYETLVEHMIQDKPNIKSDCTANRKFLQKVCKELANDFSTSTAQRIQDYLSKVSSTDPV